MTLRAEIELTRGEFALSAAINVAEGGVLAVLGPNGSGKSSMLECLAGLLPAHRCTISMGAYTLADTRQGVHRPPHTRGIGLLAQHPLLFPHLSVLDNVAFAPRSHGHRKAPARAGARQWLAEVDAAELASRRPAQLSGGQAQRVAVARALAGEPEVLLLDEPLAALDVDAAPAIRGLLRGVLRTAGSRLATVLVTHDPLDALTLADHVVVLGGGRIVERGPSREVLSAPRTAFAARLAGLNLVAGTACADGLRTGDGRIVAGMPAADVTDGQRAVAVFTPGAVAVYPSGADDGEPHGSPRNTVAAQIAALEPHGAVLRLRAHARAEGPAWADGLTADLTPAAVADLELVPGSQITLSVKATTVAIHAARG